MMQRLQCTYTELLDQPHDKMVVFSEFAAGESAAEKELSANK